MKRFISFITGIVILLGSVNVYSAGGGASISDDSPETLFTGSASSHYLLLSSGGIVSAWGDNTYGQCAAEPCSEISGINYIDFDSRIVKVAAGNDFSIALDENNVAWGFGNNVKFQLGISRPTGSGTPTSFSSPIKISENIVGVAAGNDFSVLLNSNGELLFSGMGNAQTLEIVDTGTDSSVKSVYANENSFAAVTEDNKVYYQRSDGGLRTIFEFNENIEVQSVSLGKDHLIFVCRNGENIEFYACGENEKGQLGIVDIDKTDTPILVFTIPYEENQTINVYSGEFNTVVDVYSNLSSSDMVTQYQWGTDVVALENQTVIKNTFLTPESSLRAYHFIDIDGNCGIAFDFLNNSILTFNDNDVKFIPIIEPTEDITTMYPYQYEDTGYQIYNVNFVKLNKEKFADEGKIYDEYTQTYSDKYAHWEFVNEHQFKVKIKNFINGLGNSNYNPAISTITLSKEATGENRIVGTFGPSIWNFNTGRDRFETEKNEVNHGSENGTVLTVSAFINNMREDLPLNIPSDIDVYYESPGEITENTKLGLYIYGLPQGTTVEISEIVGNTFKLTLFGNSVSDLDYDSELKICYIRAEDGTVSGVVGDFDLNTVSVFAGERTLRGFLIKAMENTPESLTLSGSLTKGRENGKTITAVIAGGTFSENLNADNWTVTGVDGVSVSDIKRLNDNTVELTLSGNSGDRYTSAELKVTCNSTEYTDSRVYDENTGSFLFADLISENHILVERQRQSSGGSISVSVSKPTASIASGEVTKGTAVELKATGQNIKIYYTTDGTTPTDESELYSVPIIVDTDMTIKFIAVSGSRKSLVQTATYTVKRASINLKSDADKIKYIAADGNMFYPDEAISRYEILEWLNRLFDIEDINAKSDFSDVSDEYENIVNLFVGAEIIEGYPDKTFKGTAGITRAEFVKMLSDMLKYKHDGETTEYTDVSGHWCEQYIAAFSKNGLLKGYPDGTFKPDNIITRAEAVVILNRIANIKPIDINEKFFDDVTDTHWACGNIYAACYTIEK